MFGGHSMVKQDPTHGGSTFPLFWVSINSTGLLKAALKKQSKPKLLRHFNITSVILVDSWRQVGGWQQALSCVRHSVYDTRFNSRLPRFAVFVSDVYDAICRTLSFHSHLWGKLVECWCNRLPYCFFWAHQTSWYWSNNSKINFVKPVHFVYKRPGETVVK